MPHIQRSSLVQTIRGMRAARNKAYPLGSSGGAQKRRQRTADGDRHDHGSWEALTSTLVAARRLQGDVQRAVQGGRCAHDGWGGGHPAPQVSTPNTRNFDAAEEGQRGCGATPACPVPSGSKRRLGLTGGGEGRPPSALDLIAEPSMQRSMQAG